MLILYRQPPAPCIASPAEPQRLMSTTEAGSAVSLTAKGRGHANHYRELQ